MEFGADALEELITHIVAGASELGGFICLYLIQLGPTPISWR